MSYTSNLEKDFLCNYINPNTTSSNKMLLSCINSPEISSEDNCNNSSINIPLVEGFTSGPGAYHVKKGECPDGQSMINGECYQVCRGCNYNDRSGYFGDSSKYPFGVNSKYNGSVKALIRKSKVNVCDTISPRDIVILEKPRDKRDTLNVKLKKIILIISMMILILHHLFNSYND